MSESQKKSKRKLSGTVVSNKSDKTIVVNVVRRYKHSLYEKYVSSRKKYHAHDENNTAKIGDRVTIIESKPLSRLKRWALLSIENN